ncbi:MAG: Serine hydroxymethyltransferase [Parcubacteria group bacterium GW2011_GWC1_43_30]|nr:MAG: Serine hydroxymethyltransferase [Parcubacteria group bacterium GW2011_GWC1_43_30]
MKDKEVGKLIEQEKKRQRGVINLIASENYVSQDILKALGSELTNKYGEGYPGRRYYRGVAVVDKLELLTQKRALKLFGLKDTDWGVNVQPLSGSPANFAVYAALVPLGETIMGMALSHGGHLTHGQKVSITGKFWNSILYEVDKKTELIDYNKLKSIAIAEKPNIIVAGFTAYAHIVDFKKFREIADACGAYLMVDMSHFAGLVAGKVYPSPFPYADIVTTTTHKTLRGPRSALIFSKRDNRELSKKIDKTILPGLQGGPHFNQIAAVAVALAEADRPAFKKYAKQVVKNTKTLSNELSRLGWRIIEGGTESHLLRVDVWKDGKGIGGREAANKLEAAGIIVNENTIPFDTRSPMDPSGLRLGTAAETTRGKKEKDMIKIARRIDAILKR